MSGAPDEPIPEAYVVQRVGEALTADDRVGEQGLDVTVEGDELIIRGPVSTAQRKAGVAPVAREVVGALRSELAVRDETAVPPAAAPDGEEVLG